MMQTIHFKQLPKPYLAYPKILQGVLRKKTKQVNSLPQREYVVDQLQIDTKHLVQYNALTGFKNNGYIPALYLAVLSQSLQMQMMSQADFPFAVLGLVHIHNHIQQHRPIAVTEKMRMSCQFGELQAHEKGTQFELITTVTVADQVVMQGVSTYLARVKGTGTVSAAKTVPEMQANYVLKQQWHIEENVGRRYALNSGDFNLIHLHAISAKAFGFKQAIAHGMWSKARILANMTLPERFSADVWFKLPIFLPSQVDLLVAEQPEQSTFLLRHHQSQKPHVVGTIHAL